MPFFLCPKLDAIEDGWRRETRISTSAQCLQGHSSSIAHSCDEQCARIPVGLMISRTDDRSITTRKVDKETPTPKAVDWECAVLSVVFAAPPIGIPKRVRPFRSALAGTLKEALSAGFEITFESVSVSRVRRQASRQSLGKCQSHTNPHTR